MRSAHATTSPSGVAGRGRRHEWLRTPSSVSDAEVERCERHVGAVDRVVVAAGHVRRERLLRRVARRTVTAVVRERDRLGERHVKPGGARDAGRDLRHLHRVGEPGAEVIVFRRDVDLALAREPPPGPRVLDAVEIAFEAQAERIGLLRSDARTRADRPGRARRERRVELVLALLSPR